jgi:hypothetical protein
MGCPRIQGQRRFEGDGKNDRAVDQRLERSIDGDLVD